MNINIRSIDFKADQKLLDRIELKLQKLERFYDRIQGADVSLKLENSGQIRDKICEIKLRVPGEKMVVEGQSKTFETATDNAIRTVKRRLLRWKGKKSDR